MIKKIKNLQIERKIIITMVVLIVALLGAYLVYISRAANNITNTPPSPPTVYISPTSQTIGTNETFTITIRENSGTTATNAIQANFTYPTNLLDYIPTTAETGGANPQGISFNGGVFDVAAEASVDTGTGNVRITRGIAGAGVTGDQQVAKLTFRSKTTGGTVALNFTTGTALVRSSDSSQLLGGANAYGNATYNIDTTGPTVSVSSPTNNAFVEKGSTQTITANATDTASSVSRVEFLVDGTVVNTDTASPYSYGWNTTSVPLGAHTIVARAYDLYNNVSTSSTINVTVRDSIAPTISLTAPTASSTVSGTSTISANATDNNGGTGISRVEFLVDGTVVNTDTASPYSYGWNTGSVTDGNHTITARAYDNATAQNIATSTGVSVTIDNSDKTPPTSPGNLRTTGNTYTSIALAWDASTDNVGVTAYRVTRNGTQIYNGTALTFNDTNLANGTSHNYSVTAIDAKGNVSSPATLTASAKVKVTGDFNGDDIVNVFDLSLLLSKWKTNSPECELSGDNVINIFDLSRLLSNWTT